jgi:hypothetical protein
MSKLRVALLSLFATVLVAACDVNPQPLPPGGGNGSPNDNLGGGGDAATPGPPRDGGADAAKGLDAAAIPPDAGEDAADAETSDAPGDGESDASRDGSADAETDW